MMSEKAKRGMSIEPIFQNKESSSEIENTKLHVINLLREHHIPFEHWGKGTAKTLDHLVKEVLDGETVLIKESSGELLRTVAVVYVDLYYTDPAGKRWKLVEEKQVFKDGRERYRQLAGSLAEKLKATETPGSETVARAVEEELGITSMVDVKELDVRKEIQDSPSYPGLKMKATNHFFEVRVPANEFKPEGYIEHQVDKDNYFIWKAV